MTELDRQFSIVVIWMATSKVEDRTRSPIVGHTNVLMAGGLMTDCF